MTIQCPNIKLIGLNSPSGNGARSDRITVKFIGCPNLESVIDYQRISQLKDHKQKPIPREAVIRFSSSPITLEIIDCPLFKEVGAFYYVLLDNTPSVKEIHNYRYQEEFTIKNMDVSNLTVKGKNGIYFDLTNCTGSINNIRVGSLTLEQHTSIRPKDMISGSANLTINNSSLPTHTFLFNCDCLRLKNNTGVKTISYERISKLSVIDCPDLEKIESETEPNYILLLDCPRLEQFSYYEGFTRNHITQLDYRQDRIKVKNCPKLLDYREEIYYEGVKMPYRFILED